MKYDYEKMTTSEISRLYDSVFGRYFAVNWDDELEPHRQEIIDCIESGTPQDMSVFGTYDPSSGIVY